MKKLSKHEIRNNIDSETGQGTIKLGALVYNRATKQYNFSRQPRKHINLNIILDSGVVASEVAKMTTDGQVDLTGLVNNLYELAEPNTFVTGTPYELRDLYVKMSQLDRKNLLVISRYCPDDLVDIDEDSDKVVVVSNTAESKVGAIEKFGSLNTSVYIIE